MKEIATKYLVEELMTREGVEYAFVSPEEILEPSLETGPFIWIKVID